MNDILAAVKEIRLGTISMEQVMVALITLVICLLVIRVLMRAAGRAIEKLPVERSLHGFMRSLIKIALYFLTVIIVAGTLGIPVTSLIAVLSVVGLAVSLAAQNSLANVAGGLTILIGKPFVVGDYVEAAGVSGTVVSIGLAYTRIKTPDNKIIYAPNSGISGEKITNYTAESLRRVDLSVGASYNNSIEQVKTALAAAVAAQNGVLMEPAPYINVQTYEDSCIRYTVRIWTRTEDYWHVHAALTEEIKAAFDAHGVEMAHNHLNIHMVSNAPI